MTTINLTPNVAPPSEELTNFIDKISGGTFGVQSCVALAYDPGFPDTTATMEIFDDATEEQVRVIADEIIHNHNIISLTINGNGDILKGFADIIEEVADNVQACMFAADQLADKIRCYQFNANSLNIDDVSEIRDTIPAIIDAAKLSGYDEALGEEAYCLDQTEFNQMEAHLLDIIYHKVMKDFPYAGIEIPEIYSWFDPDKEVEQQENPNIVRARILCAGGNSGSTQPSMC